MKPMRPNHRAPQADAYQSIRLDESKRHFVFGDIHGRFETFQRLLELINYNACTDILYSVGDLIDRGPDSVAVVEFFQQANCHAILGNHEQMILNPNEWNQTWLNRWTGGPATLHSINKHDRDIQWLVNICAERAVCLDVGETSQPGAFRLIHAESPLAWSEFELMDFLARVSKQDAAESRLCWGRGDIRAIEDSLEQYGDTRQLAVAEGRSARSVFCGHTPLFNVLSAFNIHWIDTFQGAIMTCIDPISLNVHQVPLANGDKILGAFG